MHPFSKINMPRITLLLTVILCAGGLVSCRQSPQEYVAKGNSFDAAGKYDDAIINYKKAIQRDGKFGEAYYRLALTEMKVAKTRDAYDALLNANNLLPDRTDVKVTFADFLLLGYIQNKSRPAVFYTQLTKLINDLLARDSNSYDAYRIKGAVAWTEGHLQEAEEFFQKANARKPMEPALVVMWVQVLFQDRQPAEAERLAQQLIQAHKDAGPVYDVLFTFYRSQNRKADAENILRTKVNNNAGDINFVLQLAMFYASTGSREQMTATLQRVLDDPKTFPDGRLRIGDFYVTLQDWPEAMRQYQEGANRNPKERVTYLKRMSDAWLAQGRGDQAAGVVAEILKERPKDDIATAVNASLLLKTRQPQKVEAAVKDLQELVNKQPDNPLYELALGQALLAQGDKNEAANQFRDSLKKHPDYLPAIMALAELSLSRREFGQTLEYATKALAVNPKLSEARLLRTTALLGNRKLAEARAELIGLEADFPENVEIQLQLATLDLAEKRYPAAEARLEKLYNKDRYRALVGLTEAYQEQGQIDRALSRLNLEQGKSASNPAIKFLLADTALRASKYDLALQQYEQLQKMFPRSSQVLTRIGTVYQLKGDFSKAIASLEQAKELAPRDSSVAAALGDALAMAGRHADAEASYRQMLALDPENATAMNNLAYTIINTRGATDEAQKLAERALQKSPGNPSFADTLGLLYLKKNLSDSALQVYSGLTQRFPENPVFRYHYALSLTQRGQHQKAKAELEGALRRSPPDELRKTIQSSLANLP